MTAVDLKLDYSAWQSEVFFSCKARKRPVAKGRRTGFTRGAAQYVIEQMLDGVGPVLWGDTTAVNIVNYFERYFLPILVKLPHSIWQWKKQEKKLFLNGTVCDFRSADQPENWEGFGYKIVILNEAGIILKNRYLWANSVRPMLMDHPDSICILGGTPKGKNLFHELHKRGLGSDPNWQSFTFSSYDNPFLRKSEIDELISEESLAGVIQQEIYAQFTDETEHTLISYDLIMSCVNRPAAPRGVEVWGLDIARHGSDSSVLARRAWKDVYSVEGWRIPDTMQLASQVFSEYSSAPVKPAIVFVEVTGMGWGVHDRLKELGVPVYPADVGQGSTEKGLLNKRMEMYWRLESEMKKGLKVPNEKKLINQLSNVYYEFNSKAVKKLVEKEKIKEIIGQSPDEADSVALTFFEPVSQEDLSSRNIKKQTVSSLVSERREAVGSW